MFNKDKYKNIYNTVVGLKAKEVLSFFESSLEGLRSEQVIEAQEEYGKNIITYQKSESIFRKIFKAFINPFTVVLLVLAIVSFFTDYIWVEPAQRDLTAVIIIVIMVAVSGLLTFFQTERSDNAATKLSHW